MTQYHWLLENTSEAKPLVTSPPPQGKKKTTTTTTTRKHEKASEGSYDKMLIDWVWSGRTGKYLDLGHDAPTSLRSVRTSWPRAKYFPVRPSHSVNNYIFQHVISVIVYLPLTDQGQAECALRSQSMLVVIAKRLIRIKTFVECTSNYGEYFNDKKLFWNLFVHVFVNHSCMIIALYTS